MINKKTSEKQANCSKPINEGAPDNNYDYNDAKAFAVIHKIVGDEDTENTSLKTQELWKGFQRKRLELNDNTAISPPNYEDKGQIQALLKARKAQEAISEDSSDREDSTDSASKPATVRLYSNDEDDASTITSFFAENINMSVEGKKYNIKDYSKHKQTSQFIKGPLYQSTVRYFNKTDKDAATDFKKYLERNFYNKENSQYNNKNNNNNQAIAIIDLSEDIKDVPAGNIEVWFVNRANCIEEKEFKDLNKTAIVFDPPSNVRNEPNGEVECEVKEVIRITLLPKKGKWYETDYCGSRGYIHQTQLRF